MDKAQYKTVPVDPTPEMLKAGRELFGDLVADEDGDYTRIYAAMLAAAPQPPNASGERDLSQWEKARFGYFDDSGAFQELDMEGPPDFTPGRNPRWVGGPYDMQLLRAALAPSPGIDAAEHVAVVGSGFDLFWAGSGPIAPLIDRHGIKVGSKLYAAPPAAQPSAEWLGEAERLVDKFFQESSIEPRSFNTTESARAALLAHLRTKPSTEPWCDTMDRPKSKCGCPDCGPSLIDLGPGLRNTPGKP